MLQPRDGPRRRNGPAFPASKANPVTQPAILALEDGTLFEGVSVGAPGLSVGEVVFNTAMTGYQEILTDPSYARQLVTLTCPHVGNTGINPADNESGGVQAAGLIVRDVPARPSSWRGTTDLPAWLADSGTVAIAGIDTRRLTRLLVRNGAQNGALMAGAIDREQAIEAARKFPGLQGMDLAREGGTSQAYEWNEGLLDLDSSQVATGSGRYHVVLWDYGVKRNILRLLVQAGCRVTVVPPRTTVEDALSYRPDGVMLSNGPGDPAACDYAIAAARELLERKVPTFGICLGHQILGLAAGGRTVKMKTGHHGANHPVQELATGKVMITSQNHGFAVDEASLPGNVRATHRSLFDGSNQGIEFTDAPAFGFQGHPEAGPGPQDVAPLFQRFRALMEAR